MVIYLFSFILWFLFGFSEALVYTMNNVTFLHLRSFEREIDWVKPFEMDHPERISPDDNIVKVKTKIIWKRSQYSFVVEPAQLYYQISAIMSTRSECAIFRSLLK
jgi:hypothetical protein